MKFTFFGGEPLAVPVLQKLKEAGLTPDLIICNPDRPSGRGHKLTSPPSKLWAVENNIEVYQPESYKAEETRAYLQAETWDLFVVVAYNFILPYWVLKIPKKGCLNVHPSLLPRLRGASPIRSAILHNLPEEVGVTIMLLTPGMDEGPILDQQPHLIDESDWPPVGPELDSELAELGGIMLAETIPAWLNDEILPQEQDHENATYCSKLDPELRQINLNPLELPEDEDAEAIFRRIAAYTGMGDTFFIYQDKRVKIKEARLTSDRKLELLTVVPDGKKPVSFADYLNSL